MKTLELVLRALPEKADGIEKDGTGAKETCLVGTARYAKERRHGGRATEEEEGVQHVENERERCVGHDAAEGTRDEEEEGKHGEDGDKHVVIDDGWIACGGFGDDVADESHDEQGP